MSKLFKLALIVFIPISLNAQNNNCNCCTESHKAFDFWIGNWTVTNPDGTIAGKNVIKKMHGNCMLQENWTSTKSNFTGTSNNFYNPKTKQWEQIWVDTRGDILHMRGNRKGNQMILQTDVEQNKDGQPFYHRVTWTKNEDGSVRQYWETITNGKDITVAFDGLYKKN